MNAVCVFCPQPIRPLQLVYVHNGWAVHYDCAFQVHGHLAGITPPDRDGAGGVDPDAPAEDVPDYPLDPGDGETD